MEAWAWRPAGEAHRTGTILVYYPSGAAPLVLLAHWHIVRKYVLSSLRSLSLSFSLITIASKYLASPVPVLTYPDKHSPWALVGAYLPGKVLSACPAHSNSQSVCPSPSLAVAAFSTQKSVFCSPRRWCLSLSLSIYLLFSHLQQSVCVCKTCRLSGWLRSLYQDIAPRLYLHR